MFHEALLQRLPLTYVALSAWRHNKFWINWYPRHRPSLPDAHVVSRSVHRAQGRGARRRYVDGPVRFYVEGTAEPPTPRPLALQHARPRQRQIKLGASSLGQPRPIWHRCPGWPATRALFSK